MKYTNDKYSVFAGKTEIARLYVSTDNGRRNELRVLQGMPRTETIKKICEDRPDFAKKNQIDENYYPYLFSK